MSSILEKIVANKRREVAAARARISERDLERRLVDAPPARPFRAVLERSRDIGIIAEVKKSSPSAGVLRADFDPVAIATIYATHGASCLSVLTDQSFFQGHLQHLAAIRAAVDVPILRKDFVFDRYQLLEARAAGADAVLLIAEVVADDELAGLLADAHALGMEALVELHDADQLARVVASGAEMIGINNRDLRTFATGLQHTLDLAPRVPAGRCIVSESGIRNRADLDQLRSAGVQAVLVGESLMRAADVGAALRALLGPSD